MTPDPSAERGHLIERAQAHLTRTGSPKLMVTLLLLATGAVGFLASAGLLTAGVERMPARYPLAVAAAYAVFIGLLWVWMRTIHSEAAEALALGAMAATPPPRPTKPATANQSSAGDWFNLTDLGGGDDGCAVVAVVLLIGVAVVCAVVACAWVVADAPVLLAELLVDGALLAAVAPGVHPGSPHWLRGVLRRTWWKAVVLAAIFSLVGPGLESVEPGARTMGEAFRMARAERHGR